MTSLNPDLSHLTKEENEAILAVLARDSILQEGEQTRIKLLKEELRALRMKGVRRSDKSATQCCSRCSDEFGWLFNKGVLCAQCLQKVCDKCHQVVTTGKIVCVFCMKQMELEAKCGNWFYALLPKKLFDRTTNKVMSAADLTRSSLLSARPSVSARRSSTVGTTLDEVRRALVKSSVPDADVSFMSCEEVDRKLGSSRESYAFPEEEDKKILKDLLDLRNFGLLATKPALSAVKVRQVYGSKYRDSDSSEDDSFGEVDSPHLSSCSGSAYRKSDSVRSSVQTNCSSTFSTDGITNKALATDAFLENSSHSPNIGPERQPLHRDLILEDEEKCGVMPRLSSSMSQASDEEHFVDGLPKQHLAMPMEIEVMASTAASPTATASVPARSHVRQKDQSDLVKPCNTVAGSLRHVHEENNNMSPPRSGQSSHPVHNSDANNHQNSHSTSSLSSAASSSMPSVAMVAVNNTNNKNNAGVNGTASDEENEDIGEMFALYGARRTNSQTNLNKLSPYSGSKESINSVYSNAGEENYGKFPVTGEILFGLNYNYTLNILEITIRRCKDLAPVDQKRNRSDPYVKTYLLPDRTKTGKRKTRVKKHTLSPVFDEILKYQIMKTELETRTLNVMVWNNDRFGRNDFLGEVKIPLDYYPFDNPTPIWHKLQDRVHSPLAMLTYKGDLNLCLKFVSAEHISGKRRSPNYKGELQVIVKEARNLTAVRSNGSSDPFCKGYLLPDKSHQSKQKTPVIKKNCNPKWNHTFLFENVAWDELQLRSLELTVWDHDRLTSNDFLGGVRLNLGTGRIGGAEVPWMDSRGDELSLWQGMLDRPNCWIEGTLLLRVNMNQRK